MSSSSLNPLPSSDPEEDGDAATDSATNLPASGLLDVSGLDFFSALSVFSTLAAGLAAAAVTFADGTIFDGFFSSKLKPKKSPGRLSSLACSALDAEAAELSLSAAASEERGAFESVLLDRSPRPDR